MKPKMLNAETIKSHIQFNDAKFLIRSALRERNKQKRSSLYEAAIKILRILSEKGHADAQFELGQEYEDTGYFGEHPTQALSWYRKAARRKQPQSCNSIGFYYEHGIAVRKNLRLANDWYLKAAKLGDALGQYNLACNYENGIGLKKSIRSAIRWYQEASRRGHKGAKAKLKKLLRQKHEKNP